MIFSKRNFAAACLLLGTSGLLVSCNEPIPNQPTKAEKLSAEVPGCTTEGLEDSQVPIDQKTPSGPKTAEVETADCIKVD